MAEAAKPPEPEAADMPPTTTRTVSEEELEIAYSGPAVLANKFYVTVTSAGVRIAFTEVQAEGKPPQFRTAVLLPFPDAMALQQLLVRMITENTASISLDGLPADILAKMNASKR